MKTRHLMESESPGRTDRPVYSSSAFGVLERSANLFSAAINAWRSCALSRAMAFLSTAAILDLALLSASPPSVGE